MSRTPCSTQEHSKSSPTSESVVQMLLELQQLGAVPTTLGSLFQDPNALWCRTFPQPLPAPPVTQLNALPPAFTESRAQRCPSTPLMRSCSCHEASPQPALLWAEQTQWLQLLLRRLPSVFKYCDFNVWCYSSWGMFFYPLAIALYSPAVYPQTDEH